MSREFLDSGTDATDLACAELVARLAGVPLWRLLGPDRHANVARARHVAIWATRQRTTLSYLDVGQLFGGRDHRTAIHSCEAVTAALARGGDNELGALALRVRTELLRGVEALEREERG